MLLGLLFTQALAVVPVLAAPATDVSLVSSHYNTDLQERQATWIQSRWVSGPAALAAGAAVQGIDCVYDAMVLAVRVGLTTRGIYTGAQSIANEFAGITKRDNSTDALASTLIAMGPTAINALQPLIPKIDNVTLLHIGHGSPDVLDSIALNVGHLKTGVQVRHVTNGTHGFAQVHTNSTGSFDHSKRETYSFSQSVAGLKFSYSKGCGNNDYYDNGDEGQGMRNVLYNFAYWSAYTQTADKYIMEFYNPGNLNRLYAVGTMIAEASGFGNNYEGFPYETDRGC